MIYQQINGKVIWVLLIIHNIHPDLLHSVLLIQLPQESISIAMLLITLYQSKKVHQVESLDSLHHLILSQSSKHGLTSIMIADNPVFGVEYISQMQLQQEEVLEAESEYSHMTLLWRMSMEHTVHDKKSSLIYKILNSFFFFFSEINCFKTNFLF